MVLKPFRFVIKGQTVISKHTKTGSHYFMSTCSNETRRSGQPWKVMFFGTDEFSLGSLARLNEEIMLVYVREKQSFFDSQVGFRKHYRTISKLEVVSSKWHVNPVRLFGQKENLSVHEWPIDPQVIQDFDIGFVASFGHLIPKHIIDAFPLGILNVHGSLLPRWRGAAPVNYAIMNGDSVTGVSIMRVQPHAFDKGEVISRREVVIQPNETALQLRSRLSEIGGDELITCLRTLPRCLAKALPQVQDGVCYAPKITSDLGIIDFKKMTASDIYNRYRALHEFIPLTTMWMGLRLSLHDVSVGENDLSGLTRFENFKFLKPIDQIGNVPGQVLFDKKSKQLRINCSNNSHLVVGRIAPFRKKPLKAIEFYNGYLSKKDKEFWMFQ